MDDRSMEVVRRVCTVAVPTLTAIAMMLDIDVDPDATRQLLVSYISKTIRWAAGLDTEEKIMSTVEKLTDSIAETKTQTMQIPQTVGLRRDFKIEGMITSGKNSISYISLARQLEAAQRKGHGEQEIVDAVISAVSPELHLRGFLETSKLNLEGMQKLLLQHFQEPSATELFTQLTRGVQQHGESAADFVMRMMDLRERTQLASCDRETSLKYPSRLVDQMFRQCLVTGLADIETRVGVQ
ncbi:hypothetical protein ACOMHN_013331 [Nucella lapillus]